MPLIYQAGTNSEPFEVSAKMFAFYQKHCKGKFIEVEPVVPEAAKEKVEPVNAEEDAPAPKNPGRRRKTTTQI